MILVSIIIPCYNVFNYIEECLESVYNQTYSKIEVIAVDNNSTDETYNILLELQKTKFPSLIILIETKKGANAARNKGLEFAKGEWIQFLDADDLLLETKIEHQVNLIQTNSDKFDFIAASFKKYSLHGDYSESSLINKNKYLGPFLNESGITSSNLWNSDSLISAGKWNESFFSSQETDLMLRIIMNNGSYLIDERCLTIIRERENGQISQGNQESKWLQYINVRIFYIEFLKNHHRSIYYEFNNVFSNFLVSSLFLLSKHNHKLAFKIFDSKIRRIWKPANLYGISKWKVFVIKLFGFKFYTTLLRFK